MEYTVMINEFEGPLDLLLHLIKQSKMEIFDIELEKIVNQYCAYIHKMESMNLNIASEYLIMAAELLEMKSKNLLPKKETEEEEEEDPKEELIKRLIEYQRYKEITPQLKNLEAKRNCFYTREPEDLRNFKQEDTTLDENIELDDLLKAFKNILDRKILEQPLNTKITKKEYSISKRAHEIKNILKERKKIEFEELFENYEKDYIVVTFLSILDLAKKQEVKITQESNFTPITLELGDEKNE